MSTNSRTPDDEDVDVVALARKSAAAAKAAVAEERRASHRETHDEVRERRRIVPGVPQAVVDAAVEQMITKGVSVDMRRIKMLSTGRFEVDLS